MQVTAVNSFARVLNPRGGAYILSSTDRLYRVKGAHFNDKAVVKVTLLGEDNSKIKNGEGSSILKRLLTCRPSLTGKVLVKVLFQKTCSLHSH